MQIFCRLTYEREGSSRCTVAELGPSPADEHSAASSETVSRVATQTLQPFSGLDCSSQLEMFPGKISPLQLLLMECSLC